MAEDKIVKESMLERTTQTLIKYINTKDIPASQLKETDDYKVLTAQEREKLDKIITNSAGTKYLNNAGVYKTLAANEIKETTSKKVMTADERDKVSKITTVGNGAKYLADDGTYKVVATGDGSGLTQAQAELLSAIEITGDGSKYLANDGTYKTISGSGLTEEQTASVNAIITDGDGKKYLADNGTYTKINMDNTEDGETNKVYSKEDKEKVDKIITDGDGTKVLTDKGEYVSPEAVGVIDDTTKSTDKTYSSSLIETKLSGKSDATHTHEELEMAHEHDNSDVLDQITEEVYGGIEKLITNIIDAAEGGIGTKAFFDDYKFKETNAIRYVESSDYVTLVSSGKVDGSTIYIVNSTKDDGTSTATFYYGTELIGVSGTGGSGNSLFDLINEDHFIYEEVENTLINGDIEILKQLALRYPIKVLTKAEYVSLQESSQISPTTIYITTTETTDGEGNSVDVLSIIRTNGDGKMFLADDGTYKEININIDTEMLEDSENPVQNKVIKKYIDDKEVKISAVDGNQITKKTDGIYVAKDSVDVSEETGNIITSKTDGIFAEIPISKATYNSITLKDDGLYSKGSAISADTGNILENKKDGMYATEKVYEPTEEETETGMVNAVTKKYNSSTDADGNTVNTYVGLYVEDKTADIEKLQNDVGSIKKYQKYLNTELDYCYLTLSLDTKTSVTTGYIAPFVISNGNMNTNETNYSVLLKAGKTYKISSDINTSGKGYSVFQIYDLTNNNAIHNFSKTAPNYDTTASCINSSVIYSPINDCEIQILINYLAGTQYIEVADVPSSYFIIEEIGRALEIDPVEHVNLNNGLEDTPVGHIIPYVGTIAPKHYLLCDGAEYNISDYPYLAEHIKKNYGVYNYFGGDGETTFAVPKKECEVDTNNLPTMTSNNTPAPYVVSASSVYSVDYNVWEAFDKKNSDGTDCWLSAPGLSANSANQWIMIDLSSSKTFTKMQLSPRNYDATTTGAKDFDLQGSNDGITFDTIFSKTGETWEANGVTKTYVFDKPVSYRYYRLYVYTTSGAGYLSVGDWDLLNESVTTNYYIKAEPTYYLNINGLRTETVLFEGEANVVGDYELIDSVENYDEIYVVAGMYDCKKYVQTMNIETSDIVQNTDYLFSAINGGNTPREIYFNFTDANKLKIRYLLQGDANPCITKIIGISYGNKAVGGSSGGSCSCPTYTDTEVANAVDEILNPTTTTT